MVRDVRQGAGSPPTTTSRSNKKKFEIFTAEDFIAVITQQIPDKHLQTVR